MIVIGITGSVGTGKTETSSFFKRQKVPVFDSDYEVSLLYKKPVVLKLIQEQFPLAFKGDRLLKEELASIVFEDKKKLLLLEKIIYKFLNKSRYSWIRRQFRNRKRLVVLDVPLLFEKDNKRKYDKTLVVTCSEKIQKIRVLKREGWNKRRLVLTKRQQLTDKKKKKLADIVVYSDRGKRYIYNTVNDILNKSIYFKKRSNNKVISNFKK
ncbi:MAG: Dephospho-CoA kinase [Alphaproteobacteria bacterium MarineAlpha9_Bin4]|nr:MAG: Dephospho-CoA kinase [Alphaproteobacteria bacterium MarineAlpha9_Bin4]|tara:strand:- start:1098 stop:1727 length:630 start_codon:yes stop_codon:yes gene_type:complete